MKYKPKPLHTLGVTLTEEIRSLTESQDLPDSEKVYDRNAAMETLKAILALGYRIVKP